MSLQPDDPRLVYMPERDVLAATGTCQALRDRWFSFDRERGLIFWQGDPKRRGQLKGASPQCNSSLSIATEIQERLYPWAEPVFFSLVLVPIDVKDYQ